MILKEASIERVRGGYRNTKLKGIIDEFIASDMECASAVFERGEHGDWVENQTAGVWAFSKEQMYHVDKGGEEE